MRDAVDRADFHQHFQRGFVCAAMRRAPQAGNARRNAGEGVGAGGAGQPHRRGRGVLLVIGVQDEDAVHRAAEHRVDLVLLARHRERHVEEVRGVIELVPRINEGLADGIFVGHRRNGRHLRDHADRGDVALDRIVDVDGVVIEGGKRADRSDHDGHRMRVAPETGEEPVHLLVRHRVVGDAVLEVEILLLVRQIAVKQNVAGFQEVAVLGKLLDGIAAIEENTPFAIDIGDVGFAGRGRGKAGIVGESAGLAVKLGDVDNIRAVRAREDRKLILLVMQRERRGAGKLRRFWLVGGMWVKAHALLLLGHTGTRGIMPQKVI